MNQPRTAVPHPHVAACFRSRVYECSLCVLHQGSSCRAVCLCFVVSCSVFAWREPPVPDFRRCCCCDAVGTMFCRCNGSLSRVSTCRRDVVVCPVVPTWRDERRKFLRKGIQGNQRIFFHALKLNSFCHSAQVWSIHFFTHNCPIGENTIPRWLKSIFFSNP